MRTKSKTVMSWSSRTKQECNFCNVYFARTNFFFNIWVLSQCIMQWITFTYQKTLLHTLLLLVFKIAKNLQCILKKPNRFLLKPSWLPNEVLLVKSIWWKYNIISILRKNTHPYTTCQSIKITVWLGKDFRLTR